MTRGQALLVLATGSSLFVTTAAILIGLHNQAAWAFFTIGALGWMVFSAVTMLDVIRAANTTTGAVSADEPE